MSGFKIGDKVRLKDDHPDSHWVVIGFEKNNRVVICFSQDDSMITSIVGSSRITLIDPLEPYKQAVREVLLSKEFLQAFAEEWGKIQWIEHGEISLISGRVEDLAVAYNLNEVARQHTSQEVTSSNSIPDGWRELEPKEIPKKGGRFWHDGEWVELLVDGTVEYEYYGEKERYIRKIEPPKPPLAVGDRVRVCKPGNFLDGCEVSIDRFLKDCNGMILVWSEKGNSIFEPFELQPVEETKQEPPKPAFAVGDRVRVCNTADRENGQCGVVSDSKDPNLIKVAIDNRIGWFQPSELQPVEAAK